jgi:hypothetical protein
MDEMIFWKEINNGWEFSYNIYGHVLSSRSTKEKDGKQCKDSEGKYYYVEEYPREGDYEEQPRNPSASTVNMPEYLNVNEESHREQRENHLVTTLTNEDDQTKHTDSQGNYCYKEVYASKGGHEKELEDHLATILTTTEHLPESEEHDGGNHENHPAGNIRVTERRLTDPYVCGHCKLRCKNWCVLYTHFPIHHPGFYPFICFAKCNQGHSVDGYVRFSQRSGLWQHIERAGGAHKTNAAELFDKAKDEAIKIMTAGIPEPIRCRICNYTCATEIGLYRHFDDHKVWSCPLATCDGVVRFLKRKSLRSHLRDRQIHSLNDTEMAEALQTAIQNVFAEYAA